MRHNLACSVWCYLFLIGCCKFICRNGEAGKISIWKRILFPGCKRYRIPVWCYPLQIWHVMSGVVFVLSIWNEAAYRVAEKLELAAGVEFIILFVVTCGCVIREKLRR